MERACSTQCALVHVFIALVLHVGVRLVRGVGCLPRRVARPYLVAHLHNHPVGLEDCLYDFERLEQPLKGSGGKGAGQRSMACV